MHRPLSIVPRRARQGFRGYHDGALATREFVAGYTVGGNITDLAVAYGLAPEGQEVRIYWDNDAVTVVPVQNGIFMASRAEITHVARVELLDTSGNLLQTEVMVRPEP